MRLTVEQTTELHEARELYIKTLRLEGIELQIKIGPIREDYVGLHQSSNGSHLITLSNKLYKSFWNTMVHPMRVLAHEMIHAHQVSTGKLDHNILTTMWNGKPYKDKWFFAYWRRPWEREARKYEKTLFKLWKLKS